MDNLIRTEMMLTKEQMDKIKNAHVLVLGVGGVGCAVIEGLARAGIQHITAVDNDVFSTSNLNRQMYALTSTVGQKKVIVAQKHVHDIDKNIMFTPMDMFYDETTAPLIDFSKYNFVIDAIDTLSSKILIIQNAKQTNTPFLCCLSTGNKLDPTKFRVTDIEKTSVCPLARVLRNALKKRNIKKVPVLWSDECPIKQAESTCENGRHIPGSISFVPPVAGYILAGEAIKHIMR